MKLNQFYGIGNLVRDAETKVMPNGKKKQVFTLAINDDYLKPLPEDATEEQIKNREWIHRVYFLSCYVVGKEYQNLTKGKKVLINGKIVTKNYEVQGAKKTIVMVEVFALDFMVMKDSSDYEKVPAKTTEDISNLDEEQLPF